jgi:hypothetical protein
LQFGCSIAVLFKRGKQARETLYSYRKINWHLAKSFCPGSKILVIGDEGADETDKPIVTKSVALIPSYPFFGASLLERSILRMALLSRLEV